MDKQRTKSSRRPTRTIIFSVIAGGGIIATALALTGTDFDTSRVQRDKLTIDTVRQGTLEVRVSANGRLVPENVEYLASEVNGRVAAVLVKPGDTVEQGMLLVELTNPQVVASADEAKSAWEGAVGEVKSVRSEMRANLLTQESTLAQSRFELERARVQLEAQNQLIAENIISEIDYKRSQLTVAQLEETVGLEQRRLSALSDNMEVQIAVRSSRVTELARALDRAQSQVSSLQIRSGIDGVVQAVDVEVGQQLQPGSAIGRVAEHDQLYAELRVPAREATEVEAGQQVEIDTRNGTVNGLVSRIDPGVTDGTVIVDVDLTDPLPRGSRPQLPVEGVIFVSRLADALYVARPAYVQSNASIAVYRLDGTGRYAERVVVDTGKVSLDYVEVRSGLTAGDQIITSETSEWRNKDRVLLN